jgi:STE24 endopeptidase
MTPRAWAAVLLAGLVLLAGVVAATLVPWRSAPASRADQLAALGELPPEAVDRGRAFHAALRPGRYAAMVVGLVAALVLGFTPAGADLVDLFGPGWAVRALLGGLAVVLVTSVLTLPLAAWRHLVVRRFGLSTQGWPAWWVDVLKGYAVTLVLGGLALLGFYALAHYLEHWWWLPAAGGAAALVVLLSFVFPVLVEPIFNKFAPMAEGELRHDLMELARQDGVPVRDVLVADASRRTRAVNAYVSGFGATRRIVVYDTLLERASPAEVRSVVAHELGHAAAGDVIAGTVLGGAGASIAVVSVYLVGAWSGLLRMAGVDDIAEPASVGLLLALATLAGTVSGPAQALLSRKVEARADRHALELTGDPATFEAMQARLATVNLADPDPHLWEHRLFASHPSTVERIAAARAYAREHA